MKGWHDGQLDDLESITIPVTDRGVQYGEGLFETILIRGGGFPLLPYHLDRLSNACDRLGLPFPGRSSIKEALRTTLEANEAFDPDGNGSGGILKILLTGGEGDGLHRADDVDPNLFILPRTYSGVSDEIVQGGVTCEFVPPQGHSGTPLARVKSISYLGEARAMEAVRDPSDPDAFREALFITKQGRLLQGTRTNVFVRLDGCWYTPPETDGVLPGVAREVLLQTTGKADVECRSLFRADVQTARHMMLTNAVMGPVPVRTLIAPSLLHTEREPKTFEVPDPDNVLAESWREAVHA